MTRTAITLALVATLPTMLTAGPAQAAEQYQLPNPWRTQTYGLEESVSQPSQRPHYIPAAAAAVELAAPLALTGAMITVDHFGSGGNPFYVVMEVGALGPLSLIPGYALAGDSQRGAAVAAGGYAVELLGSLVGGIGLAAANGGGGEGAGFAFLGGLFAGPAVAFGLYSLWATYDVYQTAERKNREALQAPSDTE